MLIKECIFKELEEGIEQFLAQIVSVLCAHLVGEYVTSGQWEAVIDEFLPVMKANCSDHCVIELDFLFELVMSKLGPQRFTSISSILNLKERLEEMMNWVIQVMNDYEMRRLCYATDRLAVYRKIVEKTPTFQRLNAVIQKRKLICGDYPLSRLAALPIFQ